MFKSNLPQQQKKKSVISFDTLVGENNEPIEVKTVYNVINTLYTNDTLLNKPMTKFNVINRQLSLELVFRNRAIFLIRNAMYGSGEAICFDEKTNLSEKYPFIFDLYSYMFGVNDITILDYTNVLCSEIYNSAIVGNGRSLKSSNHDNLMEYMNNLYMNIINALNILRNEAKNIYFTAGDLKSIEYDDMDKE